MAAAHEAVPRGFPTLPTVIVGLFISHFNPILGLDVFTMQ